MSEKLRTIIIADIDKNSLNKELLKFLLISYIQWNDSDFTADESIIDIHSAFEDSGLLFDKEAYDQLEKIMEEVNKVEANYIRLVSH